MKIPRTFTLDPKLIEALKEEANKTNKSQAVIVSEALIKYLNKS